jgi:hypothetical protein
MEFSDRTTVAQTAPRTVIGYHGCSQEAARGIYAGRRFLPSARAFDWLGEGIYFWEYAPNRALDWAAEKCLAEGGRPVVIKATIRLGRCLNLLDTEHMTALSRLYEAFVAARGSAALPSNTERGAHYLDREIIDAYCRGRSEETFKTLQTVRASFAEGAPIYPGSKILQKAHTQVAVRDPACILRVALVQFT